jgi:WD40 repeat protein
LLHDLQGDYISKQREQKLPALHSRLLEAYAACCTQVPSALTTSSLGDSVLWALGPDDGYFFQRLTWHLKQAFRQKELRPLLLDFKWLQAKLNATDPVALLADFDCAKDDKELVLVGSAIRLSSHAIGSDKNQLAGQLIGRLGAEEGGDSAGVLAGAAAWRGAAWLRPLNANLHPPGSALLRTLQGHRSEVTAVAVTPNGRLVVSASDDQTLKLWDLLSGRELRTFRGHAAEVNAVAITPDGQWAVSGSSDRMLKVWNLENGRELRTFTGHTAAVSAVAITPNGQWAVSGSSDCTLKVWELESGRLLWTLNDHPGGVSGVALTADARWAVSASWHGTLSVWDLRSGLRVRAIRTLSDGLVAVALVPDGTRALCGSADGTLKMWDLDTGRELGRMMRHSLELDDFQEGLRNLQLEQRVSGDQLSEEDEAMDESLLLSQLAQSHVMRVTAVAISGDGRLAVSASDDQTLKVWDLENGHELRALKGHATEVNTVAIVPNGQLAVSGSFDGMIKVWNLHGGKSPKRHQGHRGSVNAVAVMPDGRRALSAARDTNPGIKEWSLKTLDEQATYYHEMSDVKSLAPTPHGWIVAGADDGTLVAWNFEDEWWEEYPRTFQGHKASISGLAVTPDGRLLISASKDKTLRVWNAETGRELRNLMGHSAKFQAVAITPDGQFVVSGADDRTVGIWTLRTGEELRTLQGHTESVNAVAITPDGTKVVSGASDLTLKLWDLESGRELRTLQGHKDWISSLAMTPGGKSVVSASNDATLKVWDLESGACLCTFTAESAVYCCAVASDSCTIVAGEHSGRVHFLRLVLPDDPLEEENPRPKQSPCKR